MRVKRPDLGTVVDACFAVIGTGLTALADWKTPGTASPLLLAVLPLVIGVPLAWRRRAPMALWILLWTGISLQVLVMRQPPRGPELAFMVSAGGYALGAYGGLRRTPARVRRVLADVCRVLVDLAVAAGGLTIYGVADHQPLMGMLKIRGLLGGQVHGPSWYLVVDIGLFWLAGTVIRTRRRAMALARHNAALQRQAERAAAAERARIARELHDIVAHHLSVVVLQAAGGRASGSPPEGTLEKIERSGRQALAEMRHLLLVLREPDEEPELTPQPGLEELAALAENVRAAGVPVRLVLNGAADALPAAVDVSAYRIVQEALTNVLKHAGPACAEVTIGRTQDAVMIDITDDGAGNPQAAAPEGGLGLVSMRERVALFGGELRAGPEPGGGFAVRARLPLGDGSP
ncbi:MAG: sensor histidine kinase [Streptosporangiaceae bacterium]